MLALNSRVKDCAALARLLAFASVLAAAPACAQPVIEGSGTGTTVSRDYDKTYAPGGGLGLIIISRDFGPRNAITPEVGEARTVDVAPDAVDSAFGEVFGALSDDQVALINSGTGAMPQIAATVLAPTGLLSGNENIVVGASGGIGGANAISSTVNDAIGQGMGALNGALGGLAGINQ